MEASSSGWAGPGWQTGQSDRCQPCVILGGGVATEGPFAKELKEQRWDPPFQRVHDTCCSETRPFCRSMTYAAQSWVPPLLPLHDLCCSELGPAPSAAP
ncbi:unnamed protein product [Gadus morhua 'NCC']